MRDGRKRGGNGETIEIIISTERRERKCDGKTAQGKR